MSLSTDNFSLAAATRSPRTGARHDQLSSRGGCLCRGGGGFRAPPRPDFVFLARPMCSIRAPSGTIGEGRRAFDIRILIFATSSQSAFDERGGPPRPRAPPPPPPLRPRRHHTSRSTFIDPCSGNGREPLDAFASLGGGRPRRTPSSRTKFETTIYVTTSSASRNEDVFLNSNLLRPELPVPAVERFLHTFPIPAVILLPGENRAKRVRGWSYHGVLERSDVRHAFFSLDCYRMSFTFASSWPHDWQAARSSTSYGSAANSVWCAWRGVAGQR
jgi:hypothetical protein